MATRQTLDGTLKPPSELAGPARPGGFTWGCLGEMSCVLMALLRCRHAIRHTQFAWPVGLGRLLPRSVHVVGAAVGECCHSSYRPAAVKPSFS